MTRIAAIIALVVAMAQSLGAQEPRTARMHPQDSSVREVIVIIKTHFDIGYTHRVREIIDHYRTGMIDQAMDIMDQLKNLPPEQQFAWTGPGWVMSKVLEDWEGQTTARRQRLDDYVKSGKFQFHALPFTLESDVCEPEEMARGFIFASELCRRFGMPLPRSGKMTDVPSHGGALATVLARGGVKFMHIGCNWPSGYVRTPGLFWWEGPDGSRVLTFYSSNYGTARGMGWPEDWGADTLYSGLRFLPPADWPYPVWPAIIVTLDNTGPPTAKEVQAAFEEATEKLPGVRVRMGTMDDFVEAILAAEPEIPVVKDEMPDTWVHGVMCDPGGIKLSREVRPQIATAEVLHTQLNLWGVAQGPIGDQIALAYEKTLLYGEHTWGGAAAVKQYGESFQKLDPQQYAPLEASWEDKTDYIRDASRIVRDIAARNLEALAGAVQYDAPGLVVYNPLPWKRSGWVEVQGARVWVDDVPACGYQTRPLSPASERIALRETSQPVTLANAFFRLTIDPAQGAISSLVDQRTGREWADAESSRGLGRYLNERFTFEQTLNYALAYQGGRAINVFGVAGPWAHPGMHKPGMISEQDVPYRAATASHGVAHFDGNSVTLECPANPDQHLPATTLRVTLPKEQPYVELELSIQEKAKDNWPEADWLCLPFQVASPRFSVHRQLGVMNPARDIAPGANRDLFTVGLGVTISDRDGSGIAICPLDHPLVSLDRPGCWRFSKDAADFTPEKPIVYVNLYNNQWNTNFRYWYPGTWSSRVRLWTFDARTPPDAVMATPALEARNPLLAIVTKGQVGRIPAEQSGLSVSRPGVLITAFGANPDGHGTLLRVWEQAGVSGELTVTIPGQFTSATPVNLRGEPAGTRQVIANSQLVFPLTAYAPASWILE